MPRLRKPQSAIDRLAFIKQAAATAASDTEDKLISVATLNRMQKQAEKLEAATREIAHFTSVAQKEVREKDEWLRKLKTYVSDIWEGLSRRVYRENLAVDVFAYYQLPKSGNKPVITTAGQLFEIASLVIAGEAEAIVNGYAAMQNPSVAELAEVLSAAKAEFADVASADKNLDESQEAVSELMPETKELVDRVIAELNFNLYEKDDASKRRIMRNYGVRYELAKNETPEDNTDYQLNENIN